MYDVRCTGAWKRIKLVTDEPVKYLVKIGQEPGWQNFSGYGHSHPPLDAFRGSDQSQDFSIVEQLLQIK